MDGLAGYLILGALFGIFVAIQKLNSNIITQIDQNERIIELLKEKRITRAQQQQRQAVGIIGSLLN
ncbi:hypothetical protein [Paenibacillus sp. 32352]|uniref:hypothetical protein n=1 Tax=Paenibacillus sp. 32352 TaxID=1969111 RepID=UPI0009AD6817|nr:hypothetical protein [Paenibacillus sp. 32352]